MQKRIRFTNIELQKIDKYSYVDSTFTGVVKYLINQGMQTEIKKDEFINIVRSEIKKEMYVYRKKIKEQSKLIKEQNKLIAEYLKSEGMNKELIEKKIRKIGD